MNEEIGETKDSEETEETKLKSLPGYIPGEINLTKESFLTTEILYSKKIDWLLLNGMEDEAVINSLFAAGNALLASTLAIQKTKIAKSSPELIRFLFKQTESILNAAKNIVISISNNNSEELEAKKELDEALINENLKDLMDLLSNINVELPEELK